jgi:large subunit ribosomal protein L7/L12
MEEVVAKAKVSTEDLIEQIEGMSVLELANLVKELEEKFGVSAQAMAAPMMVAGAGAGAAEAEEQSAFDVVLTSFGEKKINVIKVVREVTSLGLKEAKDLVDNLPNPVKEGIEKAEADELAKKFQDAGAEVEVK